MNKVAIDDLLAHNVESIPSVKPMINIGGLRDVPTGRFMECSHGEHVLNGGLAYIEGNVGIGNSFKSTYADWEMLTAMYRMDLSRSRTYDTEVNIHLWHKKQFVDRIFEGREDVIENGRWTISDKTQYTGTKWYELHREYLEHKISNANKLLVETPFWNRDRSGLLKIILPTFTIVDSFTEFETDDVIKMQDANELGESGANTIHMRQGLAKSRFLMEAPRLNGGSGNYLLMVAHLGKETQMQNAGPGGQQPIQVLSHLKNGDKIMGVTRKFSSLTNNVWNCFKTKPFGNADNKGPYYPRDMNDKREYDTDLNELFIRNLRGKSGPSGMPLCILVSQEEGVLPSLTEFHFLKENGYFGLEGNEKRYALALYPDVTLSRTTVRGKIDEDKLLRRAINISSEILQIKQCFRSLENIVCTPKELYDDLKAKGFDWTMLLTETRGWWTYNNDCSPGLFLSSLDLLRIRAGLYFPYWMNEDKTIKTEYLQYAYSNIQVE